VIYLVAIKDSTSGVYCFKLHQAIINFNLYEMMNAFSIGSKPVTIYIIKRSPSTPCDKVNHTSTLGCAA